MREETREGGELLDFSDLDLVALSRDAGNPVLAAVAGRSLQRVARNQRTVAFYEDSPCVY
jgi:hypothetical protein